MGRLNSFSKIWLIICVIILSFIQITCTEPFVINSIDFSNVLVVEATITNELKHHVVKLTRTIPLEDFGQSIEYNAIVEISRSNGEKIGFSQDPKTGDYISDIEFKAVPAVSYTLKITTQDGTTYTSTPTDLPPVAEIERVYPELTTENGKEGIHVFIDSEDQGGEAKYFRYEYEETYKVKLPHPSALSSEIVRFDLFTQTYEIELSPRRLDLTCYTSDQSTGILQTSTAELGHDRVVRFPVRLLNKRDPVIRERYSILVRQYVQSLEAHTFYRTLSDLGNIESLLSQGQPGYVSGNLSSGSNSQAKALGFFEVSAVSSQRIYFSYRDFGLDQPPYFVECEHLISYVIGRDELKRKLEFENYQVFFYEEKPVNGSPAKIYHIAQSECTECKEFSTHLKPDFWED